MITRKEYMADSERLHHAYHLQFATKATFEVVRALIGVDVIMKSSDPQHFNDIPLARWGGMDRAIFMSVNARLKGDAEGFEAPRFGWSLSDAVCIAKTVAREIRKQGEKSQ